MKEKEQYFRLLKNRKLGTKRKIYRKESKLKYLGTKCFFCKNDKRLLDAHRKDGKRHKDFYSMTNKEFQNSMTNKKYIYLCKKCHKSVHFCMTYLNLTWEKIIQFYNANIIKNVGVPEPG